MPNFRDYSRVPTICTGNAVHLPPAKKIDFLNFVVSEARRGRNEIGFVPKPRLSVEAARGNLWLCEANGDYVGFLLKGPWRTKTHIHQIWMRADARRRLYASLLLASALSEADTRIVQSITLNCANDLDAMLFWPSLGFTAVHQRYPTNWRRRKVTTFERTLEADKRLVWTADTTSGVTRCRRTLEADNSVQ